MEEESSRSASKILKKFKEVHEVCGQSINPHTKKTIPNLQEAIKKITRVQEAVNLSQAVRDTLERRRKVDVHNPSIRLEEKSPNYSPKTINPEPTIPKSLGS